jgi:predicted transcriptional regulator
MVKGDHARQFRRVVARHAMSVVQIEIPDAVMEQARRLAARTRQSVEQVISDAVKAHAAREEQLAGFYARAERVSR